MKRDHLYLKHILHAIDKINEYVKVGYDDFMSHSNWQDAVIRQLEIVGEEQNISQRNYAIFMMEFPGDASQDSEMFSSMITWVSILMRFGRSHRRRSRTWK